MKKKLPWEIERQLAWLALQPFGQMDHQASLAWLVLQETT